MAGLEGNLKSEAVAGQCGNEGLGTRHHSYRGQASPSAALAVLASS